MIVTRSRSLPSKSTGKICAFGGTPVTSDHLQLGPDLAWLSMLLGPIPRGSSILLGGDPGAGKSTLGQQIALSAAAMGEMPLIITTEQTAETIHERMNVNVHHRKGAATTSVPVFDELADLLVLPSFATRQILASGSRYCGTTLVVIDSLQGGGHAAHDRRFYSAFYEYLRVAASARIATVVIAHVNKSRQIAGPRSLEHNVDVSALLLHSMSARALTIPKNRNGSSHTEPFMLEMDPRGGRLSPSALVSAASSRVKTISPDGLVEVEAGLSIPRSGRGFIRAPGFSITEIETVVDLVSRTLSTARALPSLGVTVRGPAGTRYRREYSLAVAVALAAGAVRRNVSPSIIAIGDVDLRGGIRPLSQATIAAVKDCISAGEITDGSVLVVPVDPPDAWEDCEGMQIERCSGLAEACRAAGVLA